MIGQLFHWLFHVHKWEEEKREWGDWYYPISKQTHKHEYIDYKCSECSKFKRVVLS